MNTSKINRIQVIDHTKSFGYGGGTVYTYRHTPSMPPIEVEVSMQDDGKTMKVFIRNKKVSKREAGKKGAFIKYDNEN